jgi:hypothetical protein
VLVAGTAVLALGACGGQKRQDANEPTGNFKVDIVRATFPRAQSLAKKSNILITVKNAGQKTVPNVAVTLTGLDYRSKQQGVADPNRPQFVVNGIPRKIGGFAESQDATPRAKVQGGVSNSPEDQQPRGGETAYVDTWALGPLKPGQQITFHWGVTAVKAGPYKLRYVVAAGLNGKARAIDAATGRRPRGRFVGTVIQRAPQTRIADDGHTVIRGTR